MGLERLNLSQKRPESFRTRKFGFLGCTGQKKTLEELTKSRCAGSAYSERLKNEHEKTLQVLICKVFLWSIGESNPVSLHCVRSVRFATVVCLPCRSADSFAHQASASLYPPPAALGSAPLQCFTLSSVRMRTLRARITKQDHREGDPVSLWSIGESNP